MRRGEGTGRRALVPSQKIELHGRLNPDLRGVISQVGEGTLQSNVGPCDVKEIRMRLRDDGSGCGKKKKRLAVQVVERRA